MCRMKKMLLAGTIAALMLLVTACSELDVVGNGSARSFDAVLQAVPEQVQADEMNAGWSLGAPDGTVRFIWSEDWSRSPLYDVMLVLDATAFLEAGLAPEKLPEPFVYDEGMLTVGTKLGDSALTYNGQPTPLAAYEQIVKTRRNSIGYHMEMDHYYVSLGDGNLFEWAKDMSASEKDMVFVLNAQPFVDAGVDPDQVEGWVFGKVETMDENGKAIEEDKLLKFFDLQ